MYQTDSSWGSYLPPRNVGDPLELIEWLASENAVVIFSISTCCMCSHAVKRLFCGMGVNPTVHELDDDPRGKEMEEALMRLLGSSSAVPVVFIGGKLVGAMDRVMASHINGAGVRIDCKFKASSPKIIEQVSISVNRTTNRHGLYKFEVPAVDGIACAEAAIESSCEASLMWSSSKSCNVPGYKSTSDQIAIKAKQANLCIYSLNALNFRPSKIDLTLCGN
ncbi:hypothetical protein GH714_029873 [Hevea brasiliensis]|uniref:Glutaredoxin domain-containing protein n=1 Tax=Hevea brasiliensis TaxID=3981 RepID=A0A6A6LK57_HEVBR|nr:hypothetical protein GH714_029873 [Hevea brasiliensis]